MSMNGIDKRLVTIGLLAWALAGAPITFLLCIEWSYRYALSMGKLPIGVFPEWLWFLVFGICLLTGLVSFVALPAFRNKNWFLPGLPYAIIMSSILIAAHLYVACNNGDCL